MYTFNGFHYTVEDDSGCDDNIPPTCQFSSSITCAYLANAGVCGENWETSRHCGTTPGRVQDSCQISCNTCKGNNTLLNINLLPPFIAHIYIFIYYYLYSYYIICFEWRF